MTPLVYTMPRAEGLHKLMTFQHGCPHHCIAPGRMYFLNTSKSSINLWIIVSYIPITPTVSGTHIHRHRTGRYFKRISCVSDTSNIPWFFSSCKGKIKLIELFSLKKAMTDCKQRGPFSFLSLSYGFYIPP